MVYITEILYEKVCKNAPISFKFSDSTCLDGHFLCRDNQSNWFIIIDKGQYEVFSKLGIVDSKDDLFERTCGYSTAGMWPEAKTKEDCLKFLEALKWVNKPVSLKVSDLPVSATIPTTPTTITTTDVIISVPKKKHVKLNFNI